jgi:hypothetical protein
MLAPSINIKQARSPGNLPGAAPIGNRVTGTSLCIENTALVALVASSVNIVSQARWLKQHFPIRKAGSAAGSCDTLLWNELFVRSITSHAECYGLSRSITVIFITRREGAYFLCSFTCWETVRIAALQANINPASSEAEATPSPLES